jgi:hypothetical protein
MQIKVECSLFFYNALQLFIYKTERLTRYTRDNFFFRVLKNREYIIKHICPARKSSLERNLLFRALRQVYEFAERKQS